MATPSPSDTAMATPSSLANAIAPKTFFDLPAEVRNIIYRLAFQNSEDAIPERGSKSYKATLPAQKLCVSKGFSVEAAPFVYGLRKFQFDTIYKAAFFLLSIGSSNSMHITSISLEEMGPYQNDYNRAASNGLEWMLHCPFEDIPTECVKLIALRCSNLRQIEVPAELHRGYNLDSRIASLQDREKLVAAFPQLSNMSYGGPRYSETVCLSVTEIPFPDSFEVWNIQEKLSEARAEKKAIDDEEKWLADEHAAELQAKIDTDLAKEERAAERISKKEAKAAAAEKRATVAVEKAAAAAEKAAKKETRTTAVADKATAAAEKAAKWQVAAAATAEKAKAEVERAKAVAAKTLAKTLAKKAGRGSGRA